MAAPSNTLITSEHTVVSDFIVRPNSGSQTGAGKFELPPTLEACAELQYAYSYFNDHLFENKLPNCLITYTRKKRVLGHFCPDRYQRVDGEVWPELALNPAYLAVRDDRASLSTLVHEQCHVWRHFLGPLNRKGERGASNGYHDIPWANMMKHVGLMPSNTGAPGGKPTGQQMTHYIIPDGTFDNACQELLNKGFKIHWRDNLTLRRGGSFDDPNNPDANDLSQPKKKDRVKFSCTNESCGLNAWAKPTARLTCTECSLPMRSPDSASTSLTIIKSKEL